MNDETDSRGNLGCFLTILVGITVLSSFSRIEGCPRRHRGGPLTLSEYSLIWLTVALPVSVWLWLTVTHKNFPSKIVFWIGFPLILAAYLLISLLLK
jgi:hypothetical protein